MTLSAEDRKTLEGLETRLRTMLPEEYQDTYQEMQPTPMRSAGLKYSADGKVAWDEIWGSFCDLAMAGGPPHKGALLGPGAAAEIQQQPEQYRQVVDEICRGVTMAADLETQPSPKPGWVRVTCLSETMAGWLLRAIVMENVAVRRDAASIDLPAAPHFRLEKEIKNVITVIAKTSHYWMGHMPRSQKYAIAELFAAMARELPLVEPGDVAAGSSDALATAGDAVRNEIGLPLSSQRYGGWLGVECPSVGSAVWMMRMLVVSNILSRREETALFVPMNPVRDPDGRIVVTALARIRRLAAATGVL